MRKCRALEHYLDCHKGLCIMLKEGGEKLETLYNAGMGIEEEKNECPEDSD